MFKGIAVLVLDYSSDDMARDEVLLKTKRQLFGLGYDTMTASVPGMCTISGGLKFAQLALDPDEASKDSIFLVNVAPRKDLRSARKNNQGEELVLVELSSGVKALVVNSGYSLSFVREHIVKAWDVDVQRSGSQFRSRDFFPIGLRRLAEGDKSLLKAEIDMTDSIPDIPESSIVYVDNFGNLKTSIRVGDPKVSGLSEGQEVRVYCEATRRGLLANVTTGSFNIQESATAFGPGSSGYDKRFYEIFVRGGSAASCLNYPRIGDKIEIEAH